MVAIPSRQIKCSHLQGKHCTKIGAKCIEKSWTYFFKQCLISDAHYEQYYIPQRPQEKQL